MPVSSPNLEVRSSRRPWADRLPPPIVMMGVPFDQVCTVQTLSIIEEMIASRRPHLLATANVDFLAQVQEDCSLRQILIEADLVVCDGTPLVWMSKWLGDPLPERVAGSDLVPLLLDLAQARGHRVYFLGGRDEVVEIAEAKIRERWPKLTIAGMHSPPFAPLAQMDHNGLCQRIREAQADMLLVSFGCPKQEKWLAMNYKAAGVPVAVGVGATIDFLAGAVRRAPRWMQRLGLEWLFRMLQEPRRLAGRYWKDIRIVGPGLLRQFLTMRRVRGQDHAAELPAVRVIATPPPILTLPERLDAISAREASLWPHFETNSIILDARATSFIDSTGTGKLVRLARQTRERGGKAILVGAQMQVQRTLDLMKLRSLFVETSSLEEAYSYVSE